MPAEVTLFVLTRYSSFGGVGFIEHQFHLDYEETLWGVLANLHRTRVWSAIQWPHGTWCTNSDGEKPIRFEGHKRDDPEREMGYIDRDRHGDALIGYGGLEFAQHAKGCSTKALNNAVFDLIAAHLGDRQVILFWH